MWTRRETPDVLAEWERGDGHATVRVRERPDGRYVVRFDRLVQAAEGETYRYEVVDDHERALERAASWRERFDERERNADDE